MTPITRKEYYLAKLAGQDIAVPSPIDREESYLAKLCGENVDIPTPITIDEMYLAAMCGEASDVPAPVTRLQMIWAGLLTSGEPGITPITREETIWAGITLEKWETVTGNPVTFTARRAAPLTRLEVAIEPVQSGSGDPSPDNVRPISGISEVNVNQSSQNHFANVTVEQGTIASNGSLTNSDYRIRFASYVFLPKGTYKIKTEPVLYGTIRVYAEGNAGSYISGESISSWTLLDGYSFTLANDRYVKLSMTSNTGTNVPISPSDFKYGCAAETLTTIPITIPTPPGTVYGGTLDVLTGVLTVTHAMKYASQLTWTNNATYANTFNGEGFTTRKARINGSNENGCYCDTYVWKTSGEVGSSSGGIALANASSGTLAAQTRIYIKDTNYANAAAFEASFANHDPMIVCPLLTPVTYQLTSAEVQSLVGGNTIWTDAGQVTLEYQK